MSDHDVGYGKPPLDTRFKKGMSGNRNGRPRKRQYTIEEVIHASLNKKERYTDGGVVRTATRRQLLIMMQGRQVTEGNVKAFDSLLKLKMQAEKQGTAEIIVNLYNAFPKYQIK